MFERAVPYMAHKVGFDSSPSAPISAKLLAQLFR